MVLSGPGVGPLALITREVDEELVTDIRHWLTQHGLEKYAAVFAAHEIVLSDLPDLTIDDVDRLGLPTGPRRRLLSALNHRRVPASDGEWRLVTAMFCDIIDYTTLARQVEPEQLRPLMKSFHAMAAAVVTEYDGYVSAHLGDGVLAYFGYPHAHEEDAERCVRAGLDIIQKVSLISTSTPLLVRVGVDTGNVIIGKDRDVGVDLTSGHAPILAARLQAASSPGQILISQATARLIENRFELSEAGPLHLKGFTQGVPAWRVDGLRWTEGRFEATRQQLALTPLVGRDEEVARLEAAWRDARQGKGRVVLLRGEPGIGKSRLTHVLRERTANQDRVTLRYQCSPYHTNSALYPVIELLESRALFTREDTVDQKLVKLEALLAGSPERVAEDLPFFATLLSLPLDPNPALSLSPQRRLERTLEALADQVEELSREHPVLMVFEDCHWIDPTSERGLDLFISRLERLPVLLVITHRPVYVPPWKEPHVELLSLDRLARSESTGMVHTITNGKSLPQEVLQQIVERTDGVPLFVEELTKSVLESEWLHDAGDRYELSGALPPLAIPTSLQASLVSRLDRLVSERPIVQLGACIGREFSYELLARVSGEAPDVLDDALDTLAEAGLMSRRGTPPGVVYSFKHALVQDAAYLMLLQSQREEFHRRIAQTLTADIGDGVAHEPELLAHHYTKAGSDPEDVGAAVHWWGEAGKLATHRVALREATAHFRQGLSLVEKLPVSAERDRRELGIREPLNGALTALSGWAAPEVGANAAAILKLTERDEASQARRTGLWAMWVNTTTKGRIRDSLEWAQRLLDEGDRAGDLDMRIFGHGAAMISYFYLGELLEAKAHGERLVALYDPIEARRWRQVTAHDLKTLFGVWACQWTWMLGYPDQAVQSSDDKDVHARQLGDVFNIGFAMTLGAYAFDYRGEPEPLLERISEVERAEEERSVPFMRDVMVPQAKGLALLRAGRYPEALTLLRRGLDNWESGGGRSRVPYLKSALAEATALNGDLEGGLCLIDECLEQIARPGWEERSHLAEVLRLKAWMLMQLGRSEQAEAPLRDAIAWAREQQARSWELRASITLAELLVSRGEPLAARSLLEPIYGWFTEGFDTRDLRAAHRLLEGLGASSERGLPRHEAHSSLRHGPALS
jgi:class 3 adenylate cyclase/tetratricopeptide (TPR) repeat protein